MKTIRVLVADDEATTAEALKGALIMDRTAHFAVETVTQGDEVLAAVRRTRPHVILLDDRWHDAKIGIDRLLPQIRAEFDQVGVVVITAHRGSAVEPVAKGVAYSIDGWIDKVDRHLIDPPMLRDAVMSAYKKYLDRGGSDA